MTHFISAAFDGKTVLDVLTRELYFSSRTVKHLKYTENGILLNGEKVTVRRTVREGDTLLLAVADEKDSENVAAVEIPLSVAYEDGEIIIPNKPPYMPTHPSRGHPFDTLANALAYRYKTEGIPFVFRPVSRLDRNTSGILIAAKDRVSARKYCDFMAQGRIKKEYIALLDGMTEKDGGTIEKNIRRCADSIITRETAEDRSGDYALTSYRVLARSEEHTLVAASPITGRTHQLRVHFASIGHPISGDDMYGGAQTYISRQALHCARLTFPCGGEKKTVFGELPEDMRAAIEQIFDLNADTILEKDSKNENQGYS